MKTVKPRVVRASYFVWVAVPAALVAGHLGYGWPHMIWSDSYRPALQDRYYLSCTYIGLTGAFTRPAKAGRCGWVAWRKPAAAGGGL